MNSTIELIVMQLRSEAEEMYSSKEVKEKIIQESVKASLQKNLKENKISRTDYQSALDILKRYEIKKDLKQI